VNEILSLWRSPLDKVAVAEAEALSDRQPRLSTIGYDQDFSAMTVYNFGYYISAAVTPDAALAAMFSAMNPSSQGITGALAFIPQQSFAVYSQAGGFSVPDQCNIVGSGGGGEAPPGGTSFFHFVITPTAEAATTFLSCTGSSYTSGGVYFRSLAFEWGSSSYVADTCIDANVWNVRAIRCTFTNCPLAFNASGVNCALEQCTINYNVSSETGPNDTAAVILGGQQCAVRGPGVFSQTSQASGSGGATGCTCISVQAAYHAVIADLQILEWTIGVDFSQAAGTLYAEIMNCEIECWQSALKIALPVSGAGGTTSGIKATSCTLAKASDSTDGSPIVTINANGGNLCDVTLIDCAVYNMAQAPLLSAQHGLVIASGSNIKIIAGTYSNNGPYGGAGIAITGAPDDVQIIGANLQPSYPNAPNVNSQKYALLVSGSPTGSVLVSGCDMTGYGSSGPVYVTGAPSKLRIIDCPGYNNSGIQLTASASQLTTGVSAATSTSPYYGPSVFMYVNSSLVTLHIFGQTITAGTGIFFLPSAYDSFYFNTAPASFAWYGQ
jgi:hypothetical protein